MVIILRATLGLKEHLNSNNSFLMTLQISTMIHRLAIKGLHLAIKVGTSSTEAKSEWTIKADTRSPISKIIWTAVPLPTRTSNISSTRRTSDKAEATCSTDRWREINITIDNKDSSSTQPVTRAIKRATCMESNRIKEGGTASRVLTMITTASNRTMQGVDKVTWRTIPINTTIMDSNKGGKASEITAVDKWAGTKRINTGINTTKPSHRMSIWIPTKQKILTLNSNIRLKKKTLNRTQPKIKN